MRSKVIPLAMVLAFFGVSQAHAIFNPSWERPIMKADLTEFDQTGHELNQGLPKMLTLNKRDGQQKPTTLRFTEDRRVMCITTPCNPIKVNMFFKIRSQVADRCGSTVYTAIQIPDPLHPTAVVNPFSLRLVDHQLRKCKDYKKYQWETSLTTHLGQRILTRNFSGNPEGVITIQ